MRTLAALPPAQLKKIAKKLVPRKAFAPVTFNSGASGQHNGILLALKVEARLALPLRAFLYDGIEFAPLGEPGATGDLIALKQSPYPPISDLPGARALRRR